MIPIGGRTSFAGDVLAIVVAETRQQARAAAELVDVEYDVLSPVTDPLAAIAPDAPLAVWGTDNNVLSVSTYDRGDVDAALATSAHTVHEVFQTQRIEHAFLEPESTLAVPDPTAGTMHVYSGGPGSVGRPRRHLSRPRRPDRPGRRRAGVQRRCVRWQGGHEQPGPDGARRLAARASGEVHAVSRGELPAARQASSDPPRVLGRLRRRWPAHRRPRPRRRRLRGLRVGRDEGARTGCRPRHRAVPRAGRGRRGDRRPDEQPGVWCVPRLRRQPGAVRDGRRARPSRRGGRGQRVGDPQAQRHPSRGTVGSGTGDGRRRGRRRGVSRRHQAGVRRRVLRRQGGGPRPRTEELGPRQRIPRGLRSGRAVPPRAGRGTDATSRSATVGRRWARGSTPSPSRSPPRS